MKTIDPKGISTGRNANGAPYVEKKASLPPSQSSPDKGAAGGGLKKGPAPVRGRSSESKNMSVKQKAPSRELRTSAPGGIKKR
ncbi:MAG: hypothetical protein ACREYE_05855 [Gammaproteobacteria bacterium]